MAEWTEEEIVELEKKYFLPTSKRQHVTLVRGEGTHVWDMHGKKYLDFVAGIAAVSLGHCHPEIVKTIERQSAQLMHTSNYYYTLPQVKLAKLLCESSGLDKVFFCNSGAEAVEGCIKIARKWGKEPRGRLPRPPEGDGHGGGHREVPRAVRAAAARHRPRAVRRP